MIHLLFICAFLHSILPATPLEQISCNSEGNFYNGTILVSYDRSELSVYKYDFTERANFFFPDITIDVTETADAGQRVKLFRLLKTNIEGSAILKEIQKGYSVLSKCTVDLTKDVEYSKNIMINIQKSIINTAQYCIENVICENIGNITKDDYLRADIYRVDFKENSVLFDDFANKYPQLNLLNPKDKETKNLQNTINLMADFVIASLIGQISEDKSGVIRIPDVNKPLKGISFMSDGYIKLQNGTFRNLNKFTRKNDITITNTGLEFTLKAEIQVPFAEINFVKYAINYILDYEGQLNVNIDCIDFSIVVSINYNVSPCKLVLHDIHPKIGQVEINFKKNGIFDNVLNTVLDKIINDCIQNITNFLKHKLETLIGNAFTNLDCEKYRP